MSSVNVSLLQSFFKPGAQGGYDIDGNGSLDRPELAKASLNLMGQEDSNAQNAGRLLSTFVQGGKDGQGLLPDLDNDNALSLQELNQFAGGSPTISSQQFQQTFGDRFVPGGSEINIDGLQNIAEGNLPKFNSNDPGTFTNAVGSLGVPQDLLSMLGTIMQTLVGMLSGGQQ